ncbi:MAG: GHKL domain-containing protein [Bacilli bacterium]|nr:GHKL domain-containing protein [Bacilli bacterium]
MNSVLYHILHFGIMLFTYECIISALQRLSNYRFINNKRNIVIFILFIIGISFADYLNMLLVKNFIVITSSITLIYITSSLKLKESILAYFKEFIIVIITEIFLGIIFGLLLKVGDLNDFEYLVLKLTSTFILIIMNNIVYIIRKIVKKDLNTNFSIIFLISIILLFIAVGSLNFIATYNRYYNVYFLFVILLLFIFFGLYVYIRQLRMSNKEKLEINNLKIKNDEVMRYLHDFKRYNHNLKYDLLLIKEVGNKKTDQIINKLLDNYNKDMYYIDYFEELPSSLVHLFSNVLTLTNDRKYNVIINNKLSKKELNINQGDYLYLYKILGNVLTNAVEAVPKDDGIVLINFYEDEHSQYIDVVNNFRNDIDMEKLGVQNYSTKNRDSGYGLYSIFSNAVLKIKASIINDLFKVTIYIPKKKSKH